MGRQILTLLDYILTWPFLVLSLDINDMVTRLGPFEIARPVLWAPPPDQ